MKQHGWIFVWREDGLIVSKEKVFSSTLTHPWPVRHRIESQVIKPRHFPRAVPTVLGRMEL